jgi:hypothetical protein
MSLFDPTDVRGPDQRRKQLMQKLAQQGRRAVPLPVRAGNAAGGPGIGRMFQGANSARPQSIHPGNVLSGVMQRLGIGGGPQMGEYGGGVGSPIGNPGQGYGDPFSRAPQAITGGHAIAPFSPDASWAGPAPDAGSFGGGFQPPVPPGYGADAELAPHPDGTVGNLPSLVSSGASPGGGLVPLGNGMFYDPASDQVVNQSRPSSGGGGLYQRSG